MKPSPMLSLAAAVLLASLTFSPGPATALEPRRPTNPSKPTKPKQPEPQRPGWTAQVDPLTTALGFVHVQLEKIFCKGGSLYIGPHLRLFNGLLSEPTDDFQGYGIELGLRVYPLGTAPDGFWVLARGVGALVTTDRNGAREYGPGGYGSLLAGYTWIFAERWVLSLGGGAQYLSYGIDGMGTYGFAPAAHTALGIAF